MTTPSERCYAGPRRRSQTCVGLDGRMDDDEKKTVREDFDGAVNMSPAELEAWLESDESKSVGQKDGGSESVGHHSGRRIVQIKRTKQADLTTTTSTCARCPATWHGTRSSGQTVTSLTRDGDIH